MDVRELAARELVAVAPALGRFFQRALERLPEPVSVVRYRVLRTLSEQPCSNAELAASVWVSTPTMSGVIEQLVRARWVTREVDRKDRRAVVLALTNLGRSELERAQRVLVAQITELLKVVDDRAVRGLAEGLEGLDAALESVRTSKRPEPSSEPGDETDLMPVRSSG
jgi:DNA-binding MarR family transcriptional regulator